MAWSGTTVSRSPGAQIRPPDLQVSALTYGWTEELRQEAVDLLQQAVARDGQRPASR